MQPENESFEEAQDRVLGRSQRGLGLLLRQLRHLNWLKILVSALGVSIFFLLSLLRVLDSGNWEVPTYTLVGIGVMIFVLATIILIAVALAPSDVSDEEA